VNFTGTTTRTSFTFAEADFAGTWYKFMILMLDSNADVPLHLNRFGAAPVIANQKLFGKHGLSYQKKVF